MGVVVLTALGVGLWVFKRYVIRHMSLPCQFCRNTRLTLFRKLPDDLKKSILTYFREHENRDPDEEGIFVCLECRTVHDDFSGEKMSREVDFYQVTTLCKVCSTLLRDCGLYNENIRCPTCGTPYKWQVHEKSGFRYLMPPAGTEVTSKIDDPGYA